MKTFLLKKEDVKRSCFLIDATGKALGRLSTQVATLLCGKYRPDFTPYVDSGELVIVINAEKVRITGKKMQQKTYTAYSGFPGGQRVERLEELFKRKPQEVIRLSVKGMLPKTKFQKDMISRLKIYIGDKHPHQAQKPTAIT